MATRAGSDPTAPLGPMLLIASRPARRGRHGVLDRLVASLRTAGVTHQVELARGPGDAQRLARTAVTDRGLRYVVAVGGDRTVHEIVNGLVDAESGHAHRDDLVLGVMADESGGDFVRTFGLDRSPEVIARHLATPTTMACDVGRVQLQGLDGRRHTHVFANIAEAGWFAHVTRRRNALPRLLGPSRQLAALTTTARAMRPIETTVTVDHAQTTEPVTQVVIANGQFLAGGLKVAPLALPDNGRLHVQTWQAHPTDLLRDLPLLRVGEHLQRPDVRQWQSREVRLESVEPLLIETDGEVLGTTPATFSVLGGILAIKL